MTATSRIGFLIANSLEFTSIVLPTGLGWCKGDSDGTDEQHGRAWACFCLSSAFYPEHVHDLNAMASAERTREIPQ